MAKRFLSLSIHFIFTTCNGSWLIFSKFRGLTKPSSSISSIVGWPWMSFVFHKIYCSDVSATYCYMFTLHAGLFGIWSDMKLLWSSGLLFLNCSNVIIYMMLHDTWPITDQHMEPVQNKRFDAEWWISHEKIFQVQFKFVTKFTGQPLNIFTKRRSMFYRHKTQILSIRILYGSTRDQVRYFYSSVSKKKVIKSRQSTITRQLGSFNNRPTLKCSTDKTTVYRFMGFFSHKK